MKENIVKMVLILFLALTLSACSQVDTISDNQSDNANYESNESKDIEQEVFTAIQDTNIRDKPNLNDSSVLEVVSEGSKLKRLNNKKIYYEGTEGYTRYWYNMEMKKGTQGWVSERS